MLQVTRGLADSSPSSLSLSTKPQSTLTMSNDIQAADQASEVASAGAAGTTASPLQQRGGASVGSPEDPSPKVTRPFKSCSAALISLSIPLFRMMLNRDRLVGLHDTLRIPRLVGKLSC